MLRCKSEQFRVRDAVVTDSDWVGKLITDMSQDGHLTNDELAAIAGPIIDGKTIGVRSSDGVVRKRCDALIGEVETESDRVRAAVAIIVVEQSNDMTQKSADDKLELWVFGVNADYRGKGYGKSLLRAVMTRYASSGLFVRCTPHSRKFVSIAQQLGFIEQSREPAGTLLKWSSK